MPLINSHVEEKETLIILAEKWRRINMAQRPGSSAWEVMPDTFLRIKLPNYRAFEESLLR